MSDSPKKPDPYLDQIEILDIQEDYLPRSPSGIYPLPGRAFAADSAFIQVGVDEQGEALYAPNMARSVLFRETLTVTLQSSSSERLFVAVNVSGNFLSPKDVLPQAYQVGYCAPSIGEAGVVGISSSIEPGTVLTLELYSERGMTGLVSLCAQPDAAPENSDAPKT